MIQTIDIKAFLNASKANKILFENSLNEYKCGIQLSESDFKDLIVSYAETILSRRGIVRPFIIDANNEPVIVELYHYFMNDGKGRLNPNAGIFIGGKVGCGKTLLMLSYLTISDQLSQRITTQLHSKDLASEIKSKTLDYFRKRPIFIDELGRECAEIKDWGTIVKPVIDLFSIRYEAGARNYITTNFSLDTLEKNYGNFIRSRMEETLNIIVLPGDSRR